MLHFLLIQLREANRGDCVEDGVLYRVVLDVLQVVIRKLLNVIQPLLVVKEVVRLFELLFEINFHVLVEHGQKLGALVFKAGAEDLLGQVEDSFELQRLHDDLYLYVLVYWETAQIVKIYTLGTLFGSFGRFVTGK